MSKEIPWLTVWTWALTKLHVRVMDINWEVLGNWGCLVSLIVSCSEHASIHLSRFSTLLILTYLQVCNQLVDTHTFSRFDQCFFRFLNSPETWLILWILLSLQVSQVETVFSYYTPCSWGARYETRSFPLCFSLPFPNQFFPFLGGWVEVEGAGGSPLYLWVLDGLTWYPSPYLGPLYCCHLCHSSLCLGNQLVSPPRLLSKCPATLTINGIEWIFAIM